MIQCHHQHYQNILSLMVSACGGAVFHSSSVRVSLLVRMYLVGDNWSHCASIDVHSCLLCAWQFLIFDLSLSRVPLLKNHEEIIYSHSIRIASSNDSLISA